MPGGRDDATCQKLLDKVGLKGKTFLADDWEGFHRLIPEDQLFTGKDLTFSIEQDNSNIRHFLARFRRRTKVVSKAVEMIDLSLRIYHYFHDNPRNFAAFAATFLFLLCHLPVSTLDWSLEATRASRQCVDEVNGKVSSQCCDGVGDVALRPDGWRRAGGSLGVAQVPRSSRG